MAAAALENLQTLLRKRGFAHTLPGQELPALPSAETGVKPLDALLGGGFARGFLSELQGTLSAGCTSVALASVAAAAARGEAVAYIDATDSFHAESAVHAGVDLRRLLLVRCRWPREAWEAVNLVAAAGGFGLIVLDLLGTTSPRQLREWQARPWMKLQRVIEHTTTVLLVLSPRQNARAGAEVKPVEGGSGLCAQIPAARLELFDAAPHWCGQDGVSLTLCGLESRARLAYQRSGLGRRPPRKETQTALQLDLPLLNGFAE
jgi:hypothetical protein